jgi:hypothetical protein
MNSQSSKSRGKIVLKKNKTINKIWHPESALIFKSSHEKLVIGRLQDGEIIPLDEEALDLCVQWKFKYDTSLVDEEEVTDSDEQEPVKPEDNESESDEELEPTKPVKPVKPEKEHESDEELEPTKEPESYEELEPTKEPESYEELEPTKDPGSYEEPESESIVLKTSIQVIADDSKLQVMLAFTNINSEVSLLHKNIDRIICDVKNKASVEIASLSKELSTTREYLATMTKDLENTKTKLATIRSALGN